MNWRRTFADAPGRPNTEKICFLSITEETQSQNVTRIKIKLANRASSCFSKPADSPLPTLGGPQEWDSLGKCDQM